MATWARHATSGRLAWYRSPVFPLAISVVVAGCATVYDGKYPYSEGWRPATVVSVFPGAQLPRPGYWVCTRNIPDADRAAKTYAVVRHGPSRLTSYTAVELDPSASPVTVGMRVYVKLFDCRQPPVARKVPAKDSPR